MTHFTTVLLQQIDNNNKITRTKKECEKPTCGAAIFMAMHKDRYACGKCGWTLMYKESAAAGKK